MLKKLMFFVFMFVMMAGLTLVSSDKAFAGFGVFGNGGFETGDFSNWSTDGHVFIDTTANTTNNVIAGTYSAALINDTFFITAPQSCSSLWSGAIYPQYVPKAVNVSFKVRYKTDQDVDFDYGFYYPVDPANVVLWTFPGSVKVFSVDTSGLTQGPGFSITRLDTNVTVPTAPTRPPFAPGVLFDYETPTLLVKGTVSVSTCDPAYLMFNICQLSFDPYTFSGLWVDDVQLSFTNAVTTNGTWWKTTATQPCP